MISEQREALRRLEILPYDTILRDQSGPGKKGIRFQPTLSGNGISLNQDLIWRVRERLEANKRPPV